MRVSRARLSERGGRPRNEDALGDWSSERLCYFVLADGAGGHGGGDRASAIVVDTVLADLRYLTVGELPPTGRRLANALAHANENIVEEQARGDASLSDMRSTAVLLAIDREARTAAWAHCGDSRLYCFRDGQISAQTRDHSMLQEMVDAHMLAPDEQRHHPSRNLLLAALGTRGELDIAELDGTFALLDRDAFLLCTDGFWQYVEEASMRESLGACTSPEAWLDTMAALVRAGAPQDHDNFSAFAVWIGDTEDA